MGLFDVIIRARVQLEVLVILRGLAHTSWILWVGCFSSGSVAETQYNAQASALDHSEQVGVLRQDTVRVGIGSVRVASKEVVTHCCSFTKTRHG